MTPNCLFCEIISGKRNAAILLQNEYLTAFNDINPKAPVHILIVPQKHISTTNDLTPEDEMIVGKMFLAAKTLAEEAGISEKGYRLVMNCNQEAGQSVYHIHLHLLGGRWMQWPPG
ncbi:MAG: histidine triad nucleotide-binding protein [bacterium]